MTTLALFTLVSVLATSFGEYESKDPAAHSFAHKFAEIMLANPADAKVFDIALVPEAQAAPIYQRALERFMVKEGEDEAAAAAYGKRLADAVSTSLHKVTPAVKAVLVGYNLASALTASGKLDAASAEEMAAEAAKDFDGVLQGRDIASPDAKLDALLDGYGVLLKRYGLTIQQLADVFVGNAVESLTKS